MQYDLYLLPLLISFASSLAVLVLFIFLNLKFKKNDRRLSGRHIHAKGISRSGGAAMILAFLLALSIDKKLVLATPLMAVMAGSIGILLFGLYDDIKQLSWGAQFFFQILIVSLTVIFGVNLEFVSNPLGGIILLDSGIWKIMGSLLAIIWVVFLMNSMNWLDGIDGVSSGVALIGVVTIFILSFRPEVNQPPVTIVTASLMGAIGAFMFLNFHPAKILAGTSGAMFMGFALAVLAIYAGAKIATTLLVLAVPIIDALWVIGERLQSRQSIFSADKRHLHYRLLDLGWSQKQVCIFYYSVTILIAFIALNTRAVGKSISLLLILILGIAFLFNIRKRVSNII